MKKRKLILSLATLVASIIFSSSNTCHANTQEIQINPISNRNVIIEKNQKNLSSHDIAVIRQNVDYILSSRYEIMKNGKVDDNKIYIGNQKLSRFIHNDNEFLEKWYKNVNLSISNYNSNLTINKIEPLSENKYIADVTYDVDIMLIGKSNKSKSSGDNYEFELQNENGTWYITKMLNNQENLNYNSKKYLSKVNDFQDYDNFLDSKIEHLYDINQHMDALSKKYNSQKNEFLSKKSLSKSNLKTKFSYSGYNSEAAINYAKLWANNRNPAYTDYKSNDCSNFVSQCLYAGGMLTTNEWHPDSVPWINVIKFYSYMSKEGYIASDTSSANSQEGDIIQFYDNRSSTWSHSAILTGYDSSGWLYSGHSNNRLDWPLAAVYPSSTYTDLRYLKFSSINNN